MSYRSRFSRDYSIVSKPAEFIPNSDLASGPGGNGANPFAQNPQMAPQSGSAINTEKLKKPRSRAKKASQAEPQNSAAPQNSKVQKPDEEKNSPKKSDRQRILDEISKALMLK